MIIDTSALVAILMKEEDAPRFLRALSVPGQRTAISGATLVETGIVIERRGGREAGVLGLVLGEPDDPRVVLGGAAVVTELEPLQTEHAAAVLTGEAVERGGAQSAAPDDDDVGAVRGGHGDQSRDGRPSRSIESSYTRSCTIRT